MITFKEVDKWFKDLHVLKSVNLHVNQGEVVVVCGPSGSGKSTLIRTINKLEPIQKGSLIVDGVDLSNKKADINKLRAEIGMVFQQFNLVKRSSVNTNVLTGRLGYSPTLPSLFHIFSKEDHDNVRKNLEMVGLLDKIDVRADSLSGGQQQRVGIARALMQNPRMILADEPVASLDPVLAHSILKYLEQLNKDYGITVLCSLHFLDLVHRYATRAIALKDGRLVFEGLPKEIDDEQFKQIYGKEAERVEVV